MKTYGVQDMSRLFQKAPRTIIQDLARRPETLPPPIRIKGTRARIWIADTVDSWLIMHEEVRKSS